MYNVKETLRKLQKSNLIHLTIDNKPEPTDYTSVDDTSLIWRLATPTSEDKEKENNTTYKWENYALKLFEIVISRHKKLSKLSV